MQNGSPGTYRTPYWEWRNVSILSATTTDPGSCVHGIYKLEWILINTKIRKRLAYIGLLKGIARILGWAKARSVIATLCVTTDKYYMQRSTLTASIGGKYAHVTMKRLQGHNFSAMIKWNITIYPVGSAHRPVGAVVLSLLTNDDREMTPFPGRSVDLTLYNPILIKLHHKKLDSTANKPTWT